MFFLISGIITRIFSNSYLNVLQKLLTNKGEKASVINFYTYLGLTLLGLFTIHNLQMSLQLVLNILIMGLLGAMGNYFIIKALSCGELSALAPINSYKPVVALFAGIFLLGEIPNINQLLGMIFIIGGTFVIANSKFLISRACLYRFLALIFSATEAILLKKLLFYPISELHFSTGH